MFLQEPSYKLIGIAMLIQNRYGYGHQEMIYQRALEEEFTKAGIIFAAQLKLKILSFESQKVLGWYKPDFIVDESIIVEIKATPYPVKRFEDQLRTYLRTSKYEVGYLINFGITPLYYQRIIHTLDRKRL